MWGGSTLWCLRGSIKEKQGEQSPLFVHMPAPFPCFGDDTRAAGAVRALLYCCCEGRAGQVLPDFPEPTHDFPENKTLQITVSVR
jgi:hypothetical protein